MYKLAIGIGFGLLLFNSTAMAACTTLNSITNSTTADAVPVMNNFTNLNTLCAPLANPTFSGTFVAPDGSTWTSGNGVTVAASNGYLTDNTLSYRVANHQVTLNGNSLGNLTLQGDGSGSNSIVINNNSVSQAIAFWAGSQRMTILSTGNVGVGTTTPAQKLDVSGAIRQSGCTTAGTLAVNSSGDIICSSDARLKNILEDYKGGLNAISRITPSLFSYKPTPSNPNEHFVHAGFIAQNVKVAIPQAVALQRDGYYSLDTTAILAASVNAIKELKVVNDNQAAELDQLKNQIAILQQKLRVQTAQR